jgi:hypothetical protein
VGRDKDLLLHLLQDCHDLLVSHGRKALEEVSNRVARLQIVEQGLDRNAGSPENGRSTHDLGVGYYDLCLHAGSMADDEGEIKRANGLLGVADAPPQRPGVGPSR